MRHHKTWIAACAVLASGWVAGGCSSDTAGTPAPQSGSGGGAGAVGPAGTAGGGGTVAADCPAAGDAVDPTAMIDDMESPDPAILRVAGRNGSWWAGGDMLSPGAGIVPNGDASAEMIPGGGRCGSHYAMHVTGHGFTSWAILTASFRYGPVDGGASALLPYDAHDRTGITFWARIGDTSANQVRFAVSDQYSRPEGGICDASVQTGATACYDTFGLALSGLGTHWTQYKVPFSQLTQQKFGLPRNQLDTTALYTVDFNFYVNEIFDLWVDDVSFY